MSLEKFTFRRAGAREILRSPAVAAVIGDHVDRVAATLRATPWPGRNPDWEIVADVRVGPGRVVGIVSGVPLRVEEAERIMGGALGSGR